MKYVLESLLGNSYSELGEKFQIILTTCLEIISHNICLAVLIITQNMPHCHRQQCGFVMRISNRVFTKTYQKRKNRKHQPNDTVAIKGPVLSGNVGL